MATRESHDSHITAHAASSNHRGMILGSESCGCFHCLAVFAPACITYWVGAEGATATCPRCGIDAVIGSASGFPIERDFLAQMRSYWFQT